MKLIIITLTIVFALFLIITNYELSEPSLGDIVILLNNENDRFFNPENDLVHNSFANDYINRSYRIIRNDNETGKFKSSVKSIEVICFANSLSNIHVGNITPLVRNSKSVAMLTLEFSAPCKLGNGSNVTDHEKLDNFHTNRMSIYYSNWSQKDAEKVKSAILKWGKLNGAKIQEL